MGFFSNRRNRIIERAINLLITSGRNEADFPTIYFEAAKRYAEDNGGSVDWDTPDSISLVKRIEGNDHLIIFSKMWSGGGTNVALVRPKELDSILFGASRDKTAISRFNSDVFLHHELKAFGGEGQLLAMEKQSRNEEVIIRGPAVLRSEIESMFEFFGLDYYGIKPLFSTVVEGVELWCGIIALNVVGYRIVIIASSPEETFLASTGSDFEDASFLPRYEEDQSVRDIVDAVLTTVFKEWQKVTVRAA